MLRFLLALLGLSAPAFAQLKWDKTWQEFHRLPEDERLETRFTFRNAGPAPVVIKSVKSSCGCTAASPDKKRYEPGDTGEISARFTFGGRKGPQRKLITVTTDDGAKQELNLLAYIHEGLKAAPALVFWRVGQPGEPRTVELTAEEGTKIQVKGVTSSNPRLKATLATVKPGEQFRVTVTPEDTSRRETAELHVQTDFPPDAPRSVTIFARIK